MNTPSHAAATSDSSKQLQATPPDSTTQDTDEKQKVFERQRAADAKPEQQKRIIEKVRRIQEVRSRLKDVIDHNQRKPVDEEQQTSSVTEMVPPAPSTTDS